MLLYISFLLIGGLLLYFGGDWIVDGAKGLAERTHVSPFLIAMVLIGFGTSAPELFVGMRAVSYGSFDIAMGNVVGSNIANLLLVLALSAVIAPIATSRRLITIDGGAALAATVAFILVCLDGTVSRTEAFLLIAALFGFLYFRLRTDQAEDDEEDEASISLTKAVGLAVLGLIALPLGAHLFVAGAVGSATYMGVPEAVIGLTVVAIGTSLPEMAACLCAAFKRQNDMAIGNILGSNVFNCTIVVGGASLVAPMQVSDRFLNGDLWLMLGFTVAALYMMRTAFSLSRVEGGILLATYAGYLWFVSMPGLLLLPL
ncbi:MAG: calcium/sodium antiporter [Pseudomonadota bacterium]